MAIKALPTDGLIVESGTYRLKGHPPGVQVIVEVGGTLGGATLTVGFMNLNEEFTAYKASDASGDPMTITTGAAEKVHVTGRGFVLLKVENAGQSTAVRTLVTPCYIISAY